MTGGDDRDGSTVLDESVLAELDAAIRRREFRSARKRIEQERRRLLEWGDVQGLRRLQFPAGCLGKRGEDLASAIRQDISRLEGDLPGSAPWRRQTSSAGASRSQETSFLGAGDALQARAAGWALAGGLGAWLVPALLAGFVVLGLSATAGAAGVVAGVVAVIVVWFVGAWMTVEWWLAGKSGLWPLPLLLILYPITLASWGLFGPDLGEIHQPEGGYGVERRLLGVPRWAVPFAVLFWLCVPFSAGLLLLLLLNRRFRGTVVPTRT